MLVVWMLPPVLVVFCSAEHRVLSVMMRFLLVFWGFVPLRKKFWFLPIFVMMFLFGGLVVFTHGSAVAPFIYTVF